MALDQTYCKDGGGKNSRRKTFTIPAPVPNHRLEKHCRNNDTASTENIQRYDQSLFQFQESWITTPFRVGASVLEHPHSKESFTRNGIDGGAYPIHEESKASVRIFNEIAEKCLGEAEDIILNCQNSNSPDMFETSNIFEATRIESTSNKTPLKDVKLKEQAVEEEVKLLVEKNRAFIMKQKGNIRETEVQIQKVEEARQQREMKTALLTSKKIPYLTTNLLKLLVSLSAQMQDFADNITVVQKNVINKHQDYGQQ